MGYNTEFSGRFALNKKLDTEIHSFLSKLSKTRRMKRSLPPEYGVEGEFYVDGKGLYGQDHESSVVDFNRPPSTQPSLWCQWRPSDNGLFIQWDGSEKFYNYVEWIEYIIDNILKPNGYYLNGDVSFQGEDPNDNGIISIKDNIVCIISNRNYLKVGF